MTDKDNKGGRPSIGKQVSVTIPEPILDQVDAMAKTADATRADVLREIVVSGVRARTGPGDSPMETTLAPIAETMATWIGSNDAEKVTGRFRLFRRLAPNPYKLAKLFQTAYGQLVLDGHHPSIPSPAALDLVTSKGHDGWRSRTVLFFMTINTLIDRGISVRADADDDDEIDFGPKPEDDEPDYA
ncbi:ribbon-helix-helix domain-containing protein [Nonomuraea purpurea]|uniref:Ribbon-helix-helix domain-containing protein n=1 Tax=Nonomuraea purpurea TaxID=1849276 RepID=A0ABV8G0N1_9ACTN